MPAQAREELQAPGPSDQARRLLWWKEAALSGWSPLGVFALALIPYMALVEVDTPAYHWAQPVLKAFGLCMLAWFLGIWVVRLGVPRVGRLRQGRTSARELLAEQARLVRKYGARLAPDVRARLEQQAAAVDAARLGVDPERLGAELKALSELMDKSLGALRRQSWSDVAVGVVLWLGVALLIRAVLIEPFRIPSGSMIPTLAIGDQIFVNKFLYGVRIPYVNKVPFVFVREPARGDVIVFNNPVNTDQDFIKRVVGVPGDVVELKHEQLFINGVAQARRLVSRGFDYWEDSPGGWIPMQACRYEETLGGVRHATLQLPTRAQPGAEENCSEAQHEHQGPFQVPPGHVFVMGDNRDNSADSRFGLGAAPPGEERAEYVPYGNIKGKAMVIWLSWSHGGLLSGLFGGSGLRTDRFFLPVR